MNPVHIIGIDTFAGCKLSDLIVYDRHFRIYMDTFTPSVIIALLMAGRYDYTHSGDHRLEKQVRNG